MASSRTLTTIGGLGLAASLAMVLIADGWLPVRPAQAAATASIPPPVMDINPPATLQVAVLAGGCFWGMEGVFQHVRGVRRVESGYAGGTAETATYAQVSRERTAHAEAIRIVYDPAVISYGRLLQLFFAVAHDPTQLNRQGPDVGLSYRSAIFPQSDAQRRVAAAYIAQLDTAKAWPRPIATRIEDGAFFRAEAYHQDFMNRNPDHPYIRAHDRPKVAALRTTFPEVWRSRPAP